MARGRSRCSTIPTSCPSRRSPASCPRRWTQRSPPSPSPATGRCRTPAIIPHYTNVQMPFPGPPPALPERVTTGVYRTTFAVPRGWKGTQIVLHVGGAESVHAVYVNGVFVGYGTDSRLPSEYDISQSCRRRQDQRPCHRRHPLQRRQLHRGPGSVVDGRSASLRPRRVATARAHRRCALRWRLRPGDRQRDRQGRRPRSRSSTSRKPAGPCATTLRNPKGRIVGKSQSSAVPHAFAVPYVFMGHVVDAQWDVPACAPWSAESPNLYEVTCELISPERASSVETSTHRVGLAPRRGRRSSTPRQRSTDLDLRRQPSRSSSRSWQGGERRRHPPRPAG